MATLEKWSVWSPSDAYTAPESVEIHLQGKVYGHSTFGEGNHIVTSGIAKVLPGGNVVTHSGSVYTLGEPDPLYVEWCKEHGGHVPTKEEPIKLIKLEG